MSSPFETNVKKQKASGKGRRKCLQQGMSKYTTPLVAVKPLRFP
jgi:hypothetical protein